MRLAPSNLVATPAGMTTVAQLRDRAAALHGWARQRVVLASDDPLEQMTVVAAAVFAVGFEAAVVPAEWLTPEWSATVRGDCHWICSGLQPGTAQRGEAEGTPRPPGLVVYTSGSTRAPAPVAHDVARLDTFGRVGRLEPRRWLVAYRPGSYAWAQMAMLGLTMPGQDLVFARSPAPADLLAALADHVSAVSSTPSLWRYLLACAPPQSLRRARLQQITLGGEPVDQPLLDRLRAAFPGVRITHIYASTECGAVLSCSDGRAGFPTSCLARPAGADAPSLRIEDGTLRVRSPFAAVGGEVWVDTRDLARVEGDRLHVLGRAERDAINVGGQTVALGLLERLLHELPGVAWARAYPVPSALVGSLVGADIVLDRGRASSELEVERAIRRACRDGLGDHYEPRVVRFVAELPLASSLKGAS